jgi:hypothetical protein
VTTSLSVENRMSSIEIAKMPTAGMRCRVGMLVEAQRA